MIDEQLREASRQLDTATQRIAIPAPRQHRAPGPLKAVAAATVIVVAIGAAWVMSDGSTAEQPVGSVAVSSPDEPAENPRRRPTAR